MEGEEKPARTHARSPPKRRTLLRAKWTCPGSNRTPLAGAQMLSERDNQLHHMPLCAYVLRIISTFIVLAPTLAPLLRPQ